MKRPFSIVILIVVFVSMATPAFAAPLAQGPKPVITQPEPDSAVRGTVGIVGSATHPQFQRYELYYAPFPVPGDNAWIFIGDAHFQQQPAGLLGTWAAGGLPDGSLRWSSWSSRSYAARPTAAPPANRRSTSPNSPTAAPRATALVCGRGFAAGGRSCRASDGCWLGSSLISAHAPGGRLRTAPSGGPGRRVPP